MNPSTLLALGAALLALVAVTALYVRSPTTGIALLLTARLWPGSEHATLTSQLPIGLTVLDLLVLCAMAAAVVRLLRNPLQARPVLLALGLVLLLITVSFVTGAAHYGARIAGNEMRTSFAHVFGLALYAVTLPPTARMLRRIGAVWVVAAYAESLMAVHWWSQFGIGSTRIQLISDGLTIESRALSAPEALLIAQAAVLLLCADRLGRRRFFLLAAPLLLVTVLLQHRTVWLAAAVMVGGWLLLYLGRGRRALPLVGVALIGVSVALATALGLLGGAGGDLAASASDSRTLMWRATGWLGLLDSFERAGDWLTGLPFGTGFARMVDGGLVTVSPHNYYLHLLLRTGVLGLSAFLFLYAAALADGRGGSRTARAVQLLAYGQLMFAMTYSFTAEQGLVIGLLIAHALNARRRIPPTGVPPRQARPSHTPTIARNSVPLV
ncbi:O-antigen ligase family protein [Streptomyces beijiangensis]|uniref:O-antigen ligase family protein n=1 Tax=Streptomyces beijiangensis TaxID=163361 RepID=A0A939FFY6_9ACTN|nr:O-antigen ligase family protein [Streptomyces beijiangensis]MBO0517238.1 O-antigen ligase family protein [Streptomyces beijiangensis]